MARKGGMPNPDPAKQDVFHSSAPAASWGREKITIELDRAALKRLDEVLGGALTQAGHGRISRRLLLGALVQRAPDDGDQLYAWVRDYRSATLGDLMPTRDGKVVPLRRRERGRPRAS